MGTSAHREYVIFEMRDEEKSKILQRLNRGGLVNTITMNDGTSYYINDNGRELYDQLVKVEQHWDFLFTGLDDIESKKNHTNNFLEHLSKIEITLTVSWNLF